MQWENGIEKEYFKFYSQVEFWKKHVDFKMAELDVQETVNEGAGFEYLDHTADVLLHSWGDTIEEAFELSALAMTGYMTSLESIEITQEEEVSAEGHDMESLLFNFLDEVLFLFNAEPFLACKEIKIVEFDRQGFKLKAVCRGEPFDLNKHPQGTEVKAITYSNLQVLDGDDKKEVYVVVDI